MKIWKQTENQIKGKKPEKKKPEKKERKRNKLNSLLDGERLQETVLEIDFDGLVDQNSVFEIDVSNWNALSKIIICFSQKLD